MVDDCRAEKCKANQQEKAVKGGFNFQLDFHILVTHTFGEIAMEAPNWWIQVGSRLDLG